MLDNTVFVKYNKNMQWAKKVIACLGIIFCTALLAVFSNTNALKVDFRKPDDAFVVRFEYANTTPVEQTLYIAGVLNNSLAGNLASGATFEVTEIKHTYPYQYNPARGLVAIDSGEAKTQTAQVRVSDAVFVNGQNQLSYVLTPNTANFCGKLSDVKGCVWDYDRRNQWNPDNLSCLGAATLTCEGTSLNTNNTNKLLSGYGGVYELTFRIKGTIEKDTITHFPIQTYQFTPSTAPSRTTNLTPAGLTVFLTDRAVASLPSLSQPSNSSSVASSSVVSSVSSSTSSAPASVSSLQSSSPSSAPTTSVLVPNDVPRLDIFCQDGVVSTRTTCSFTLPLNKTLPPTTLIAVDSGQTSACTARSLDVTCTNVVLPTSAGSKSVFLTLGTQRVDTGKKVNVVAKSGDLVRTGAGDATTLYTLLGFFGFTILALLVVNRRKVPSVKV